MEDVPHRLEALREEVLLGQLALGDAVHVRFHLRAQVRLRQ